MKRNLKVIEPNPGAQIDDGLFREIAIYIRELLHCDYALVALLDRDALRVQAVAQRNGALSLGLKQDLISRLKDWGPQIADDARLVAAPVSCYGQVAGVLLAYSSKPGTFTGEDLKNLVAYTNVAAAMVANDEAEESAQMTTDFTTFTTDELRHFFRLITMGEFSACFAHEVRNPLMLIREHLRSMDETLGRNHPLRNNFDAIGRASLRIEELAKRMLDFSRKRTRRPEPCNIEELISDALRFVQPYIRSKFIDVQLQIEPHLPPIDIERWQMLQAIVNILQNAADAMDNRRRRTLSITACLQENCLQIVVSDTGTGILRSDLSKIFKPFFTTKGDRGTGLGLFITQQVVQEHGGTVTVETSECGTSFHISLPL